MYIDFIVPTLIMSFVAVIAICAIVFPILFLVQKRKHHRELMMLLKENNIIDDLEIKSE